MLKIVYNIANVSARCIPKYKSRGVAKNAFRGYLPFEITFPTFQSRGNLYRISKSALKSIIRALVKFLAKSLRFSTSYT